MASRRPPGDLQDQPAAYRQFVFIALSWGRQIFSPCTAVHWYVLCCFDSWLILESSVSSGILDLLWLSWDELLAHACGGDCSPCVLSSGIAPSKAGKFVKTDSVGRLKKRLPRTVASPSVFEIRSMTPGGLEINVWLRITSYYWSCFHLPSVGNTGLYHQVGGRGFVYVDLIYEYFTA